MKEPQDTPPIGFLDLGLQTQTVAADFLMRVTHLLQSSRFIGGEPVEAFERAFANYCGASHCVGLNSGTDGLRLALIAAGVTSETEVITSPFTFIATAETIGQTGRIVLADVDPETFNLSPERTRERLTSRTRVLLPVHIFGLPADMPALQQLAEEKQLALVEDACQAHGAAIGTRRTGSFGQSAAFSFYPTKNLGAFGDAGAVTTNDPSVAERIRVLRNHGQIGPYLHQEEGFNSRLDTFQAVVLLLKLSKLESWNSRRRELAARYRTILSEVSEVRFQKEPPGYRHCYHLLAARVERRRELIDFLAARGIETKVVYPVPTHLQAAYRQLGHRAGDFPVAEAICREVVCFPLYPGLDEGQVEQVAEAVKGFYDG